MAWKLEGGYFEACNCQSVCPCIFLSPPTEGDCTVVVAWHIDKGQFDALKLDGLNVVFAVYTPGEMHAKGWEVAVYLDDKATAPQKDALTKIFAGQAGGHPAVLASFVAKILGVASVPITYQASGKNRSVKIPNIAEVQIEAISGQGGGDVTVSGPPLCIVPGIPSVAARSKKLTYTDHGKSWSLSNRNGFYSPFLYQA